MITHIPRFSDHTRGIALACKNFSECYRSARNNVRAVFARRCVYRMEKYARGNSGNGRLPDSRAALPPVKATPLRERAAPDPVECTLFKARCVLPPTLLFRNNICQVIVVPHIRFFPRRTTPQRSFDLRTEYANEYGRVLSFNSYPTSFTFQRPCFLVYARARIRSDGQNFYRDTIYALGDKYIFTL